MPNNFAFLACLNMSDRTFDTFCIMVNEEKILIHAVTFNTTHWQNVELELF